MAAARRTWPAARARPCGYTCPEASPFGNWPVLLDSPAGDAEGLDARRVIPEVETNGFWATDPGVVEERLTALADLGMQKSTVNPTRTTSSSSIRRACGRASRRPGESSATSAVQVRWLDWYERMQDLRSAR